MPPQRTTVYIDGFNLYYCSLRNTPHKWLNLEEMCDRLFEPSQHAILKIKYFTARITAREDDPSGPTRQDAYLRALTAYCPRVEIIEGFFLCSEKFSYLAPAAGRGFVKTIKTEEKGSDVNFAVHLLNDAWLDAYDCAIMLSNDSDMYESASLAKLHCKKRIGWMVQEGSKIHVSRKLAGIMDFKRKLSPAILAASQLPDPIPGTSIVKPSSW